MLQIFKSIQGLLILVLSCLLIKVSVCLLISVRLFLIYLEYSYLLRFEQKKVDSNPEKFNKEIMASPGERFAEALTFLKKLQDKGMIAINTVDFPRTMQRQLLLKKGFIKQVSKGWYISSDPNENIGETTTWYSSYWEFIGKFLDKKYGENWCLSADQSLLFHVGNQTIPQQLLIRSPLGNNKPTPLPHNTSIFNLKTENPPSDQVVIEKGIRMYSLQASLIYASATTFSKNPIDARSALTRIRDASELLHILLENGHSTLAGRLAGAFRNIGRDKIADQIMETFKQADYQIREADPFDFSINLKLSPRETSPYANRMRLIWNQMRGKIIEIFPKPPEFKIDPIEFMQNIEDIYVTDAYHSLSIERYRVSPELIEKVSSGQWNSKESAENRKQIDAMAARGYYQAFQSVKKSIKTILSGANSGLQVDKDHSDWYRQLFDPSVTAGLLKSSDLSGYRNQQVYIGNSKHLPLAVNGMRDSMQVLFELLEDEKEASVRAVLGHFLFIFIHPYMDGNGRIGRFLMNVMLASGGFPWTVIPLELRNEYMHALEKASVEQNIVPFAEFVAALVNDNIQGNQQAKLPAKIG